jgi:hypothetical protein
VLTDKQKSKLLEMLDDANTILAAAYATINGDIEVNTRKPRKPRAAKAAKAAKVADAEGCER